MEVVAEMAETQRIQEVKLDELKNSICRLHDEHQKAKEDKEVADLARKEAEDNLADLNEKYESLLNESKQMHEQYSKEVNLAKIQCSKMEHEMKTTYEQMVVEMRSMEDKNRALEEDLAKANDKLKHSTDQGSVLALENEKLKSALDAGENKYSILKLDNEKTSNDLHNCKMQLLKERNANDRLIDELKRSKKDLETRGKELAELKKERESLNQKISHLIQDTHKGKVLEAEIGELKAMLHVVLMTHNSMEEKVTSLHVMLKGETATIAVQTDLTNSVLDKYENLDREATMMLVGLREQIVNLKQQYFECRQENDALKGLVHENKKSQDLKDENERVGRLENAVKSLSNTVSQESYEPTRESCIVHALLDIKKDLDAIKSRTNLRKMASESLSNEKPVKLISYRNPRYQ